MSPLNAIKNIASIIFFTATSAGLHAQTAMSTALSSPDAKLALASRVVALQQGPEMDRLLSQLARSAAAPLVAPLEQKVNALPQAKQEAAAKTIDEELQKFGEAAISALRGHLDTVSNTSLVPAYMERFSEEELRALVAMLDAPVFKKYQTASPELGNILVRGLVDASRTEVQALAKDFEAVAIKAVGPTAPTSAAPKQAPRTGAGAAASRP